MTINYSCANDIPRSRLPFGVPLEDIFPCNDIHPYLKVIFTKAYQDIKLNGYPIKQVLTKLQGNTGQRLAFKEIVVSCKPMPSAIPPGILLWVLRHFIGLLPLPLLPNYSNGQRFSWDRLAQFCKRSFTKYTPVEVNNRLLINKLAKDLSRLSPVHVLLLNVLFNFIRALALDEQRCKTGLNAATVIYLVRYFISCIFVRPYNPGSDSKRDRQYFPLLLYLILKWPAIRECLGDETNGSIKTKLPFHPYCYPESIVTKVKIKDTYTQTDFQLNDGLGVISEDERFKSVSQDSTLEEKYLDAISDTASENDCTFLRDTGCQTENFQEECKDEIGYFSHANNMHCCCSYGSNYESSLNGNESLNKYCQTTFNDRESIREVKSKSDVSTSTDRVLPSKSTQCELRRLSTKSLIPKRHVSTDTDDFPYYGWVTPSQSPKSTLNRTDLCSPHTFISDNQYIYDDYTGSTLNLLGNTEETSSVHEGNDVLGRIAKIGWTYTPPVSAGPTSPLVSPKTTSKTALKEIYTLCYNDKERTSTEDKENCSSRESLKSKQSIGNVSSAKSKKSFTVANIKSKLDFLKIFTGKKNKLESSCSFDEISNVKYKKMNSTRSTMF